MNERIRVPEIRVIYGEANLVLPTHKALAKAKSLGLDLVEIATHARQWALDDVAKHCENPKLSDDEIGGGDWFVSYLRQCHREM